MIKQVAPLPKITARVTLSHKEISLIDLNNGLSFEAFSYEGS
jgi:hypothetical protein